LETQQPEIPEHTNFARLPRQALYADLLSSAVFAAFVTLGGTALLISMFFTTDRPWSVLLVAICIYGLFLLWCFGWPILSYRRTSYRVGPNGLEIRRGVLWRSHHRVPRSRIQHGDVSQGPFQRPLGIGKLSVFTAGSARHTTSLQGIEIERAYQLRDELLTLDSADASDQDAETVIALEPLDEPSILPAESLPRAERAAEQQEHD
jgi:membrane protein YdbS with pleckstrin-like domain